MNTTCTSIKHHRRGIRLLFIETPKGMIGRVFRIPREDRPDTREIINIAGGSHGTH